MKESLRELVKITSALELKLIESDGEITPDLEKELQVKDIQLPEKIDGYDAILERLQMLANHFSQQAQQFSALANLAVGAQERLEDNLKFAMEELKTTELKGVYSKFKLQNNPPKVLIQNEEIIEEVYKRKKEVVTIDKKAIAEELKLGLPVRGATLIQGQSIRRYKNTPGR